MNSSWNNRNEYKEGISAQKTAFRHVLRTRWSMRLQKPKMSDYWAERQPPGRPYAAFMR